MTDTQDSLPWIEKYRPKYLNELTQTQNLINLFNDSIKTGDMSHYLFYGPPGTGKTSAILAIGREIFKEHFQSRVIEFNASDDRGINAVREKITNVAKKYVTGTISRDRTKIPPYKIIILDEADSMTDEAQDALRVIIEQYSTVTRFCFICNYISKITDAIKSRCSAVYFKKLSNQCMIDKLKDIATTEKITMSDELFNILIDVSNGDMRKAIMQLQNLKYLHDLKQLIHKPFNEMNSQELKLLAIFNSRPSISKEINEEDVYEIASSIPISKAHQIIKNTLNCQNIASIIQLSKRIIAMGFPIDNVLIQLNKAVLETDKLNEKQKASIINYSGPIFLKMKNCANEYIQLSDYLSCVFATKRALGAYQLT